VHVILREHLPACSTFWASDMQLATVPDLMDWRSCYRIRALPSKFYIFEGMRTSYSNF